MVSRGIENAQKKVEGHHFDIRKNVLKYDDTMNEQRRIIYEERDRILSGENLRPHVLNFVEQIAQSWIDTYCSTEMNPSQWQFEELWGELNHFLTLPEDAELEDLSEHRKRGPILDQIKAWAEEHYQAKEDMIGAETMRAFEKWCLLQTLDQKWIDHLRNIDQLRDGIGLRGYGQKDPQLEFIREAYDMFSSLKHRILEDTVRFMFKLEVRQESEVKSERSMEETKTNRDEGDEAVNQQPVRRTSEKIGRNDPCWCGSGKKWKKCHYPQEEE